MADPPGSGRNGNGIKTIGIVSAMAALVFGVAQIQGGRIDELKEDIVAIRVSMAQDDVREREDPIELAALKEKFVEVETQFRGLREVHDVRIDQLKEIQDRIVQWRILHDQDGTDSERMRAMEERIKAMERILYAGE